MDKPNSLQIVTPESFAQQDLDSLRRVWAYSTGRCTSFAIKVVDMLNEQHAGVFDFVLFDVTNHRLAWCRKTNVLLDSGSPEGAFILPEGVTIQFPQKSAAWLCRDGQMSYTNNGVTVA